MTGSASRSSDPVRESEFHPRKDDQPDSTLTPHDRRADCTPSQSPTLENLISTKRNSSTSPERGRVVTRQRLADERRRGRVGPHHPGTSRVSRLDYFAYAFVILPECIDVLPLV